MYNLHFDNANSILWQRKNILSSYKPVEAKDKIYYNQGIELCAAIKIYISVSSIQFCREVKYFSIKQICIQNC